MSGKWTKRGIECEHEPSHLVANKDGIVVCNKRKPREEVPVGKLIIERLSPKGPYKRLYRGVGETLLTRLAPSSNKTPEVGLIARDPEIQQRVDELAEANAMVENIEAYAKTKLEALSARFQDFIYEKGLAAPTLEALHDPRYGCGLHPEARFLWRPFESLKVIKMFRRDCVACLNPELARVIACEPKRIPEIAYKCFTCGFVLGGAEVQNDSPPVYKKWYCTLCGTKIGEATLNK